LLGKKVVDARGKIVLPGVVDLHVHFSEPGRTHWEGWAHGSRAAAAGGVTTVVEMPLNAIPATVNRQAFDLKKAAAEAASLVDFALWGGLVDDNLSELSDLMTTGVMGVKAFMVDTRDDTFRYVDEGLLRRGMETIAGSGLFLAVHAEENSGTWARTRSRQGAGRIDRRAWHVARSPEGEIEAIRLAIALAAETSCPLHIVHVSLPEGIEVLQEARRRGQNVTWETCAHYLSLTDEDFFRMGPEAKCAPPLRDRQRLEGLWDLVKAGQFDCITSDHSPCPDDDKTRGTDDVWKGWGGITGIQSLLPTVVTEGVANRGLPWTAVARLLSQGPAERAGQSHRKGSLTVGKDADVVVVDPLARWELRVEDLWSRNRHSAFVGKAFQGRVDMVLSRGRTVFAHGMPHLGAGGVFLPRDPKESLPVPEHRRDFGRP